MQAPLPPDEADRLAALENQKITDTRRDDGFEQLDLRRRAGTDPLTGLYTRRFLDEIGQHEAARVRRLGHTLTAALIDIDKFKTINDTFGPPAGDAVLRAIGQVCKGTLRAPDVVARYDGEEIAVVLPDTDLEQAKAVLERLRKNIMALLVPELLGKWVVTASIGAAELHKDDADIAGVLARADTALYRAKEAGRNRVEFAQAA
jgi:diguanylate cyclase (GGDEF)-like protein